MFTMIYVNDISGAGRIVPDWMVHFSERHQGGSGMTFVDLVFPAFLFIVGMSIPFALGARVNKGEPFWQTLRHVLGRTLSLLVIGVLMVNESPDATKLGWSPALWSTLMYLSAVAAFCDFSLRAPTGTPAQIWRNLSVGVRAAGFVLLVWLAFAFVAPDGHRIITLSPFAVHTEWWGILGLIGWAYLAGSMVFLVFRGNRTALLGCMALLLCLYPADRAGAFNGLWLAAHVGFGDALGSQAAITVGGMLLASVLLAADTGTVAARVRFTLWFIAGSAAAALLVHGLYGISKNSATPSWCLWACAVTASLWLLLYFATDVRPVAYLARPLVAAGRNVLLAYLLSEMLPSALTVVHLGEWYDRLAGPDLLHAVTRSAGCGIVILAATAALNRLGFRLKL